MRLLAASLLALASVSAYAADPTIFVSMKVEQNGQTIAEPSVLLPSAQKARLSIGDRLQIELVAADLTDRADLRMSVYAKAGEALNLVGTPRVVAAYGQEVVVSCSGESGYSYKLTVKPLLSKTE